MPMMSTPSSVTSPAMHAILVVPMSRPTMISLVLGLAISGLLIPCEGNGDVIGTVIEVDRAYVRTLRIGELAPRCIERLHALCELGTERSKLDRDGLIVGAKRERSV